MADRKFGIETLCLHAGQIPDAATGARAAPIYQTTSFVFDSADHAASLFNLQTFGNVYSRISNPTVAVFEERMAAVEGGRSALASATGQAAEATALLTLCKAGDHIVSASTLYGGTHTLLQVNLQKLGVETTFVHPDEPKDFEKKHQEEYKADLCRDAWQSAHQHRRYRSDRQNRPRGRDSTRRRQHRSIALPLPADAVGRRHRGALGHQVHRRPWHHHGRRDRGVGEVQLG